MLLWGAAGAAALATVIAVSGMGEADPAEVADTPASDGTLSGTRPPTQAEPPVAPAAPEVATKVVTQKPKETGVTSKQEPPTPDNEPADDDVGLQPGSGKASTAVASEATTKPAKAKKRRKRKKKLYRDLDF